jgi:hypothetical protein
MEVTHPLQGFAYSALTTRTQNGPPMTDFSRASAANADEFFETPAATSWDAYAVWRERVQQGKRVDGQPQAALNHGWDPYFVWLSRVKKVHD